MNNIITIILFLGVQVYAYWAIQTIDPNGGTYCSLALDTHNYAHVAYYDSTNGDLKYARWTGTGWAINIVDSANMVGKYCSIAVDTSGYVHISYYDETNQSLKYAKKTNYGWFVQTIDSNGVGTYTSLALDTYGYPHIAYRDETNSTIKIARYTGSSWQISTYGSSFNGIYLSLTIDSQNRDFIAFKDKNNDCLKWAVPYAPVPLTIDSSQNSGGYCSLKITPDGKAHVSYSEFYKLKYAYYDGTNWAIEEVISSAGSFTSLALDPSGSPHIAFYRTSGWFRLDITKKTTSTWVLSTVDNSADCGRYVSLAIDTSGYAHMAYYDSTNDDLKYARWIPSSPSLECAYEPGYYSDAVEPDIGSRLDTFVFKITYKNTVPILPAQGYPKLHIKKNGIPITGSPFIMTEIDPNDINVLDGKIYSYSIQLSSIGSYSYYIEVYDVENASTSISYSGPNVRNLPPQLFWTQQTGYEDDGVEPNIGDVYSTFYFRIKVVDPEGDPIASGYPKVYVKKNGFLIGGSPFTMDFVDNNIYEKSLKLTTGINAYTYFFEVYDVYMDTKTVSVEKYGPEVNTPPQLFFTQETGYQDDAVEPNYGNSSSIFQFRILYVDPDGHPPLSGYPKVYIRQGHSTFTVLSMNYVSGIYSAGAVFSTSTILAPCSYYSYIFEVIDTPYGVRYVYSSEFPGPVVTAKIQGYVFDPANNPMQNIKVCLTGYSTAYYVTQNDGFYEFQNLVPGQQYIIYVDTTNISWNFTPSSITFLLLSDLTQNFVRTNQKPILCDAFCEPYIAHSTTPVRFQVKYKDIDNDPPKNIRLHIKKADNTVLTLTPSFISGNYANGAVFSTSTLLSPCSFYSYAFEATDFWDDSVIQISSHGPDIRVFIKGKIFNPDGTNMENVSVILSSSDTEKVVLTDKSGEYEFLYLKAAEDYSIVVSSHPYYHFTPQKRMYPKLVENQENQNFQRNNTPPVLQIVENSVVEPKEAPPATSFTYKIKYIDAENDPPIHTPLLTIKRNQSIVLSANMNFHSGTNYIDGITYEIKYSLSLAATTYSYIIETKDVWNSYAMIQGTGPVVNSIPVLENANVVPQLGDSTTFFVYTVEYMDPDGHPPLSGYPKVYILKNSTVAIVLSMNFVSGGYSTKAIFSTSTCLLSGNYSFYIETYDQLHDYTKTIVIPGPVVNNKPYIEIISYTTEIEPQENFSIAINYVDVENHPPANGYPLVSFYIRDQLIHQGVMEYIGGSFNTGATYRYSVKFSTVSGNYSFVVSAMDSTGLWPITNTEKKNFVVSTPPSKPQDATLYQDKNNAIVTSSKVILKWQSVDPDPNSRITYELWFGDNPNNMKKIYEGENTEYTIYSLDDGKTYYWYVVAKDDTGRTSNSSLFSFSTPSIPQDKVFNYPNPFKKGQTTNIVFYSDTDTTAEIYICSLFGNVLFSDKTPVFKGSNIYQYDGKGLDFSGSYVVLVKVGDKTKKGKILLLNK